jgi:hypothetical protein
MQVLRAYIYVLLRAGRASLALDTVNKAIAQSAQSVAEVFNTEHTHTQLHEQKQEHSDASEPVVDGSTASAALLLYKADALLCLAESGYDTDSSSSSSTPQESSKLILDTTQAGMCYYSDSYDLHHTSATLEHCCYISVFDIYAQQGLISLYFYSW